MKYFYYQQIVYADSQFMLAAVHPSKVQFEIQRSRGSVTEADNRDCMTEKISNNSMYNKDDDNHLQKQTEDNIIQVTNYN